MKLLLAAAVLLPVFVAGLAPTAAWASPASCELSASRMKLSSAPTANAGWVYMTDIAIAGYEIPQDTDLKADFVYDIVSGNDTYGTLMETLLVMTAVGSGCDYADGPKYATVKGIDLTVDDRTITGKVIIYEAKQWTKPSFWRGYQLTKFQLSSTLAGYQLSPGWIDKVLANTTHSSKSLVSGAKTYKTLLTAGAVVDRDCGYVYCSGHFYVFPIKVP
jgi:hypothetical protein